MSGFGYFSGRIWRDFQGEVLYSGICQEDMEQETAWGPPDVNTKPAPRCLHISFSDIIVKFVNHITLPPMQKLRSPGASFLPVFSGKGPGKHKMHGRPRLICGMMDAGSTRKRKEADRQPGSPCLCLLSVNRISYKPGRKKDASFYCFCPSGGSHGTVPAAQR